MAEHLHLPRRILLIMHAPLASAYLHVIEHIYGTSYEHNVISHNISDDMGRNDINCALLASLELCREALMLTDLIGATPYQCARQAKASMNAKNISLMTNVNLPMILRAVHYQHLPLPQVTSLVREIGQKSLQQQMDATLLSSDL